MDLAEKRELNKGFGDGLARAFEIVATPMLFALMGYGLDRVFHTRPVLVIGFAIIGVVGMFAREWYVYDGKMRAHDDKAIWGKR